MLAASYHLSIKNITDPFDKIHHCHKQGAMEKTATEFLKVARGGSKIKEIRL